MITLNSFLKMIDSYNNAAIVSVAKTYKGPMPDLGAPCDSIIVNFVASSFAIDGIRSLLGYDADLIEVHADGFSFDFSKFRERAWEEERAWEDIETQLFRELTSEICSELINTDHMS